jgi:hypothetical protein
MVVVSTPTWDEKNDARPFWVFWGMGQGAFIIALLVAKLESAQALDQFRHGQSGSMFFWRCAVLIPAGIAGVLYINLIMNGFWRRNPKIPSPDDAADAEPDISSLGLNEIGDPPPEPETKSGLFQNSSLDDLDPIITRDEIQWKKMLLATCGLAMLSVSFFFMFS